MTFQDRMAAIAEPTPQRFQHDEIGRAQSSRSARVGDLPPRRVETQTMLDRYARGKRPAITRNQYDAGVTLYREWRASGCEIRIIATYDQVIVNGIREMTDDQIIKRGLVEDALGFVGPFPALVLVHVCCFDFSAQDWALKRGYRPSIAKSVGICFLKESLSGLHRFYASGRKA